MVSKPALIIGKDVPWNAAWSGETGHDVRPCRWAEGRAAVWQRHAPGEGRPHFADPHMTRQRQSVARMLCTVCGEPTQPYERFMFALGMWTAFGDGAVWATTESPVHRQCADLAAEICPHLRRQGLEPIPFPEGHKVVAQMVGGAELKRTHGLDVPVTRPVVGHLKIILPSEFARTAFGPPKLAIA